MTSIGLVTLPAAIAAEGPNAAERFVELFTANIRIDCVLRSANWRPACCATILNPAS